MAKAPNETRIPTFGSRIPIPGKFRCPTRNEHTEINKTININTTYATPNTNSCAPTSVVNTANCTVTLVKSLSDRDIGKTVCVGNTQTGVLCFVGNVEFSAGLWCGIELTESVGKHDGCVKGIRYFQCRPGCGLMAPISKVELITNSDNNELKQCDINNIDSDRNVKKTWTDPTVRRSVIISSACTVTSTEKLNSSGSSVNTPESLTWLPQQNSTPLVLLKSENKTKTIHHQSSHSLVEKQNSFELEESLGILTPDQMVDFSLLVKNLKTPSCDDLKSKTVLKSRTSSADTFLEKEETLGLLSASEMRDFSVLPLDDNTFKLSSDNKVVSNSSTPSESLLYLPIEQIVDNTTQVVVTPLSETYNKEEDTLGILSVNEMGEFSSSIDYAKNNSSGNLINITVINTKALLLPEEEQNKIQAIRPSSIDFKQVPLESPCRSFKLSASLQAELASPSAVENSMIDFSLGLLEEDMLATGNQFSSIIDTETNLEIPLDSVSGDIKDDKFQTFCRSDQTPSPEDLPLDPICSTETNLLHPSSDPKTDLSKPSATTKTNSFITSVTSITSLDNGYQGDGEMSRPASRGADHSPIAHKLNNPALIKRGIARRHQDPMTDSDFFTESDADVHEEAPKGDRHAQVIDGTLYAVSAQANAAAHDIYIENQEEMDSSGIFTDLDNADGQRLEINEDNSPSDVSTKTISGNSQEIKNEPFDRTLTKEHREMTFNMEIIETGNGEKLKSPTQSVISNCSSRKTIRTRTPISKDENPSKKIKIPNKNVPSKVKTMMDASKQKDLKNQENVRPTRKITVNKWDSVMNKITKGQDEKSKIRLKDVKSKISTGLGTVGTRNDRKNEDISPATKAKIRRPRCDLMSVSKPKSNTVTTCSNHSSVSDLSIGTSSLSKTNSSHSAVARVTKKREVGVRHSPVIEVLTPGGNKNASVTSPRPATANNRSARDAKKAIQETKNANLKRMPNLTNKSSTLPKEQSRVSGVPPQKGGSPLRNQVLQEKTQQTAAHILPHLRHSTKGVEALGVLVQYLVFNLDAFRTPGLKRELENIRTQWIKDKLELEETRMGYRRLEDTVSEQKLLAAQNLEEERVKYRAEITDLFEKHRLDVTELNEKNKQEKFEFEQRFQDETSELKHQLDSEISNREHEIAVRIEAYVTEHRYRLKELEHDNEKLRKDHQIALEILREENDSIREQVDEKISVIEDLNELKFINEKLKKELLEKDKYTEEKIIAAQDEIALLKEENRKILETFKSDTKDNKLQAALGRCTQLQDEVESLRTVLDLKLAELSELRRAHGELTQAAEELPAALLRAQTLQARVEDLELQLERKTDIEMQLTKENKRLQETFNQETKQNKRLSLHNEELQWKLKQNSEVVNAILQGQTPQRKSLHGSNQSLNDEFPLYKTSTTSCNTSSGCSSSLLSRTHHTSSFNEKHHHHSAAHHLFERTLSFRERTLRKNSESKSSDYFELDDSPPSSPKVKGVVEKSDSVSWVLDMDESPEVIASRMVRRAGSFRNVTPPKSTPTKSPATKRPRTKSNNLSLSASAGAIIGPDDKNDNRFRSKSHSPDNCHPGEYLSNSWHYSMRTNTPPTKASLHLENHPDLQHDSDVAISLPALPSEIINRKHQKSDLLPSLPSGDLLLLQTNFPPKIAAGEAMISESNSEDECSSSTSEHSASVSDTETSEERDKEKCPKMQYDLFLLTESTTNSEVMDCSWSEELDV